LCKVLLMGGNLTQTPTSLSRKECESVSIQCVFEAASGVTFKSMEFFRQIGKGTQLVSIPVDGRFVVKADRVSASFSLEINELEVQDGATYYCRARFDANRCAVGKREKTKDGTGTAVIVTKSK
uniref:Immunoglobulin subtype domain-containing protein n=1 Tax=Callorhinchus milii TaxID=7868 RepID=A0A4W3GLF4_CALMI